MLLYLSIATIILSIVLIVFNWKNNFNAIYLAFFFILVSVFGIAHYYMIYGQSAFWLAIFYNNFAPFMFLLGPFLLFYIRGSIENKQTLYKRDWIHFVPALLAIIGTIPYYLTSFDEKITIANRIMSNVDNVATIEVNLFYNAGWSFALRCTLAFIYLVYCIRLVWKLSNALTSKQFLDHYLWLVVLLSNILFINTSFLFLALQSAYDTTYENIAYGQVFYLLAGIGFCFLSFSLILFPNILYGIPKHLPSVEIKKEKKVKKEVKVDPEEDPFYEMSKSIADYLVREKSFLNTDFKIEDLAKELKHPLSHVEYCFTYLLETKFSKYITKLRLNYVKEVIDLENGTLLNSKALALQSGFKSTNKLKNSFEKQFGLPLENYIEQVKS